MDVEPLYHDFPNTPTKIVQDTTPKIRPKKGNIFERQEV